METSSEPSLPVTSTSLLPLVPSLLSSSSSSLSSIGFNSQIFALNQVKKKLNSSMDEWKLKVKLLFGEYLLDVHDIKTIGELKGELCEGTGMIPKDLLVVSAGRELMNDELCPNASSAQHHAIYAMVRSNASSLITIPVNCRDGHTTTTSSITVPASSRVFHVSRELHRQKIVSMRPSAQRLVLGSRTLSSENSHIGNYVLAAAGILAKKRKHSKSSTSSKIVCPTLFVSRTVDLKAEVKVHLLMGFSKKTIDFSAELGQTIGSMQDILTKQFFLPADFGVLTFYLCNGNKTTTVADEVLLDRNKTLFDYNVTASTRQIIFRAVKESGNDEDAQIVDLTSVLSLLTSAASKTAAVPAATEAIQPTPAKSSKPTVVVVAPSESPTSIAAAGSPTAPVPACAPSIVNTLASNSKKRPAPGDKSTDMFRGMKKGFLFGGPSSGRKSK